jgi:tripartite-type tricarboxylate transporter receptor subunit TctC
VQKLESAIQSVMSEPGVIAGLNDLDVQPAFLKAADAQKWLEGDVKKLSALIQSSGLAVQP